MPHVCFVVSNDRHHTAMMAPVAARLAAEPEMTCSLLSLCEFRGIATSREPFESRGVSVRQLLRRFPRPVGRQQAGASRRRFRRLARRVSWELLLRPRLARALEPRPDLVVLPNDAAFPYDGLARMLHARGVPFVLMQEGIRFPLPIEGEEDRYGSGGAIAIAAWGEASAEHFRRQGVPAASIHLTGTPRFDGIGEVDWRPEGERLRTRLRLPERNVLFLSNPIDDQGFCSTREKVELIARFVAGALPVLEARGMGLVVKLHGRESAPDVEARLAGVSRNGCVRVLTDAPLYPLFTVGRAAVVLASTVGLEALMFGLSLGVLEIPGHGFVHDYVQEGAAVPLSLTDLLPGKVTELIDGPPPLFATAAYVRRHLAVRSGATERVAGVLGGLLERPS